MAQEQLHLTLKCILFGLPPIIMIKKKKTQSSTLKNWDILYKNSDSLDKSEAMVTLDPRSHMGMNDWLELERWPSSEGIYSS